MKNIKNLLFLASSALFIFSDSSFAEEIPESESIGPWKETYFQLQLVRNHPLGNTDANHSTGKTTVLLGYRYSLTQRWIMGVTGHFKSLSNYGERSELALLALGQETLYSFRLFHPHYLLLGGKVLYLSPAEASKLPVQKADGYDTEIGGALTAQYVIILNEYVYLNAQVNRWRGFHSRNLSGFETSIGLAVTTP